MESRAEPKGADYVPQSYGGVGKTKISDIVIVIIVLLLSLTCVLPFIHIASKSISSDAAVLGRSVYLWPKGFTFKAYISIFNDGLLVNQMVYSIYVTVIFTVIGMILTVCAAFPLSRKRLKGRGVIGVLLMFTMYFSAGVIPEYMLYRTLNLYNTMWVLILPLAFSPYNMLICKSFLQATIPDSLEEAARLDGATDYQFLFRIVLPLSKPIIATLSLFYAVGRWNAYSDAKFFITKRALQPIQYILASMVLSSSEQISVSDPTMAQATPEVLQAATIMFATLPILVIYPFVQRHFVRGVMIGAVKG